MDSNYAEIGAVCMGLHVRRAARKITKLYDDALAPIGLTIGQFSLLTTLAAEENWGMQALADALGTDRTSLTAALKPLERKDLVRSVPHKSDQRVRLLVLTPRGQNVLNEAMPYWEAAQRQIERMLGDTEVRSIRTTFSKLI